MYNLSKTQHYSNSRLLENLLPLTSLGPRIVEPFVGRGDLVFETTATWETYDIEPKYPAIQQDTLLNPPNYARSTIITNPPYLARNKTPDKTVFNKYQVDDLYKAFLSTIEPAQNALLVLPIGFLTNSKASAIRHKVFQTFGFYLNGVEFFTTQQFATTTSAVCVVYIDKICKPLQVWLDGELIQLSLLRQYDYFVGAEWLKTLPQQVVFGRNKPHKLNLAAYLLDTPTQQAIRLAEEPYFVGLPTDRTKIALTCDFELSPQQVSALVADFNAYIGEVRKQHHNLIFSSYREFGRKRLDFTTLFKVLTKLVSATT